MCDFNRGFKYWFALYLEGGGVAGLSAVATAKNMGAIVRAFDTRAAVKEQIQSLGAEFLEIKGIEESGEGNLCFHLSISKTTILIIIKIFLVLNFSLMMIQ